MIDPAGHNPGRRPVIADAHRAERSAPSAVRPAPDQAQGQAADRIELSDQARLSLQAAPPTGQVPAARLAQILGRLRDGFYDRPDVIAVVAERLTPDVGAADHQR